MKKHILLLLTLLFLFSCSAQKEVIKNEIPAEKDAVKIDTTSNYFLFDYINNFTKDDYQKKLDSIKNGASGDFFTLRMAYTKTPEYSPYNTGASLTLKSVEAALDSAKYDQALKMVNSILSDNFVNIRAHLYGGYIYKQLNDTDQSDFHYWCYEGLINSILYSGDGKTPKTAFIVITTKEEYEILYYYRLSFSQQSLINADGHSFDILQAKDNTINEEYEIYFNIDIPFGSLAKAFGG